MADLRFDLRIAARRLTRAPLFAIVAISTLALAIGAITATYSIVQSVLLRPIALPSPDRLVRIYGTNEQSQSYVMSPVDLEDYRQSHSFASMSSWAVVSAALIQPHNPPARMRLAAASGEFFQTLAVTPAAGRLFLPSDDRPNTERVVVLSDALWRHRFGAKRVVGKFIDLDGRAFRVIGVTPAGFAFPAGVDLWTALRLRATDQPRGSRFLNVIARLKEGASLQSANAELRVIGARLAVQYPATNRHAGARAITLFDDTVGNSRRGLLILSGAVGFVLLIACTTIANLLLARALRLGTELRVRAALGAGRLQIVRQLAIEHLLLAFAGGIAGFGVAIAIVRVFVAWAPPDFPRLNEVRVDGSVLLFTFGLSIVTAILFGIAPVIDASRDTILVGRTLHLKGSWRLRSALVVSQTALALITLFGALLFAKSFVRLMDTDPGFRAENRFTADMSLPRTRYSSDAAVEAFYRRLIDAVKAHPGVTNSAASAWRPMDRDTEFNVTFQLRERSTPAGDIWRSLAAPITPDYPATMGIPLLKGRLFTSHDDARSPAVLLVNDAWAAQFTPHENPIGMHLIEWVRFGSTDTPRDREIVGVVGNVRQVSLDQNPQPMVYLPHSQAAARNMSIIVQTHPGSADAASILRDELRHLDPDIPLDNGMTLQSMLSRSVARPRMYAAINATLALLAIVLAVIGVYGVLSFLVIQRQQELGVRMALGAAPHAIATLILRRGALLIALGTVAGIVGAMGLGRLADALLYETSSRDPMIMITVVAIVMITGLAASAIPALRSSKINPATILRGDA